MMSNFKSGLLLHKNRLLYTIYFFIFCLIDQRVKTASGLDGTYEFFRNLTGIIMALLIFSHYKAGDLRKLKKYYIIWSIAGIIMGTAASVWGYFNNPFPLAWFLMVLGIFLFGYIIIYTIVITIKEKRYPCFHKPMLITWAVMMTLMFLSRSDYAWPFFYLVMFGLFFLTPYTGKEQEDMFQGILNGVILSFFAYHAFCCVFRPYDAVRYVGIYTNSNIAGLYYLQVLAAVMIKYLYTVQKKASRRLRAFYRLGLGVVLSFLFMCIGRTAWIVACLLCVIFLILINMLSQKKRFILNGLALLLCACIMFPCTFGIVRYTPPLFHHPVWFWGEWHEDKVHSWDPWDSEKYIDMDELLDAAVGRLQKTLTDMLEHSPFAISAEAAEADATDNRAETAVLTPEQGLDGVLVRSTIYSHYFHNLNLWGHTRDEQGLQLTPTYWVGHAHNIYLQYGSDFGIIVLALFIGLSAWACKTLVGRFKEKLDIEYIGYFIFALIPLAFGLLEYCWGVSTFSILMLFMAWGRAIRKS